MLRNIGKFLLILLLVSTVSLAQEVPLEVTEEDLSPSVHSPWRVKFTNGTVTNNNDGTVSISIAAAADPWSGDNSETIDNSVDDMIEFQGVGGTDNTDLRIDLDGTRPVIDSPTDTVIEFADGLILDGDTLPDVDDTRDLGSVNFRFDEIHGTRYLFDPDTFLNFDGTVVSLFVNGTLQQTWPASIRTIVDASANQLVDATGNALVTGA